MMGRASQAFVTDGFSAKSVKENFNVVREMWMEQVKTDPRVRYTDTRACQEVDLTGVISAIKKPTLILSGEEIRVFANGHQAFDAVRSAVARKVESDRAVLSRQRVDLMVPGGTIAALRMQENDLAATRKVRDPVGQRGCTPVVVVDRVTLYVGVLGRHRRVILRAAFFRLAIRLAARLSNARGTKGKYRPVWIEAHQDRSGG